MLHLPEDTIYLSEVKKSELAAAVSRDLGIVVPNSMTKARMAELYTVEVDGEAKALTKRGRELTYVVGWERPRRIVKQ